MGIGPTEPAAPAALPDRPNTPRFAAVRAEIARTLGAKGERYQAVGAAIFEAVTGLDATLADGNTSVDAVKVELEGVHNELIGNADAVAAIDANISTLNASLVALQTQLATDAVIHAEAMDRQNAALEAIVTILDLAPTP